VLKLNWSFVGQRVAIGVTVPVQTFSNWRSGDHRCMCVCQWSCWHVRPTALWLRITLNVSVLRSK